MGWRDIFELLIAIHVDTLCSPKRHPSLMHVKPPPELSVLHLVGSLQMISCLGASFFAHASSNDCLPLVEYDFLMVARFPSTQYLTIQGCA